MRTALIVILTLTCSAGVANAAITYLTDTRTVRVTAMAGTSASQSDAATGPVFNRTVHVTASYTGIPAGSTDSTASQNSQLLSDRVTGSGGGNVSINIGGGSLGSYFGSADSDMDVTFHLDVATPYSLVATASAVGGPPPSPSLILFSLSGGDLAGPLVIHPGGSPLNSSGTLGAGNYHLEAHAHNSSSFGAGQNGSFNFTLMLPTPCGSADFNCDGDVGTDADIEAFFACLAGTCPPPPCTSIADFNRDGDTGTDADIEAFFRVLAGGTC